MIRTAQFKAAKAKSAVLTLTKAKNAPTVARKSKTGHSSKPRKPVNRVSTKRAEQLKEYAVVRKRFLDTLGFCRCHMRAPYIGDCSGKVDIHHFRGRIAALLCDPAFFIPLCRKHHNWVHANPEAARQAGLLCPKGQWNTISKP